MRAERHRYQECKNAHQEGIHISNQDNRRNRSFHSENANERTSESSYLTMSTGHGAL